MCAAQSLSNMIVARQVGLNTCLFQTALTALLYLQEGKMPTCEQDMFTGPAVHMCLRVLDVACDSPRADVLNPKWQTNLTEHCRKRIARLELLNVPFVSASSAYDIDLAVRAMLSSAVKSLFLFPSRQDDETDESSGGRLYACRNRSSVQN